MINTRQAVQAGETPEKISISMITQDLKDGVTKAEMSIKYSIKPWEVDEMFKHPLLKGKRPARKRTLSFSFVDDMSEDTSEPEFTKRATDLIEEVEVDPNQVTLEQVIEESNEEVKANWDEHVKAEIVETERSVLDILSPTELETSDNELEIPSFNDTLDLVEEQEIEAGTEEEEVEVEEDEFDSFQL